MSNPNLKKIIKLTQTQYDILSNGGTVGDYTGLNDNYLYLIQSDSPDLPIVGSGDKNKYLHTNSSTGNLEWVDLTNITITTTTGSESISDGTNTLNVVTRDTDQTIDSNKTIAVNKFLSFTGENYTGSIENNSNRLFLKYSGNNKLGVGNSDATFYVTARPGTNNTYDLGTSSLNWKDLYLGGTVKIKSTDTSDTAGINLTNSNGNTWHINTNRYGALRIAYGSTESSQSQVVGITGNKIECGNCDIKTSGSLTDGTNSITIANIVNKNDLATVATSGSYDDLIDLPTLGALAGKDQISSGDVASGYYLPTQYISQASASGNTLTLTSVGGTSLTYTPTFTEQHVGDVVSVGATSGSHISIGGTTANPTVGVESGYSIPSNTNQTSWSNKYDKPSTGIPASDLAEEYYLASNPNGYTSNTGTVTSVRVQAGAGLVSSQSTAQTSTLNTTISIDSGYKLPTTSEWNSKADVSAIPTVNDATLTIQQNGTDIETFTANSSSNKTVNIITPQIEDWRS